MGTGTVKKLKLPKNMNQINQKRNGNDARMKQLQ